MEKIFRKPCDVIIPKVEETEMFSEDIYNTIDFANPSVLRRRPYRHRRSPIIVEFSSTRIAAIDLQRTMEAGMNIAKYKLADTTTEEKQILLKSVKKAAAICAEKRKAECLLATCSTLKTWVIRTGILENPKLTGSIEIKMNTEVKVTNDTAMMANCNEKQIFIDYMNLGTDMTIGKELVTDHGEIMLKCIKIINSRTIKCLVTKGGALRSLQTVFIRQAKHQTPFLTKSDLKTFQFCFDYQIDMLLVYYIDDVSKLRDIKRHLGDMSPRPLIFTAICNQTAIDSVDAIIKESDGVILTRDYLTFELDSSMMHSLPRIQKWIAGKCLQYGKPMFLAGGIFREVITKGRFCDSEIADVTNAILDGVTGFMLKDCFNIDNTVLALKGLHDVCCSVEPLAFRASDCRRIMMEPKMPVNAAEAAAISCIAVANQTKARVIVIPTVSGQTARTLLWLRPGCIVITVSTNPSVARLLYTCRNIVPLIYRSKASRKGSYKEMEDRVAYGVEYAIKKSWLQWEDMYISLQRSSEDMGYCDMVKILKVDVKENTNLYYAQKFKEEANKFCENNKENEPLNIPKVEKKDSKTQSLKEIKANQDVPVKTPLQTKNNDPISKNGLETIFVQDEEALYYNV